MNGDSNSRGPKRGGMESKSQGRVAASRQKVKGPDESFAVLREELLYLWEVYGVAEHYRQAFLDSCGEAQSPLCLQQVKGEIESLYSETAPVQKLALGIRRRETAVEGLVALNNLLKKDKTALSNEPLQAQVPVPGVSIGHQTAGGGPLGNLGRR